MEQYIYLNDLLLLLTEKSGVHICVHDISGILHRADLSIENRFRIHSKDFCTAAKSTRKGYDTCMRCKALCNRKAAEGRKCFYGHCPFGLFEVVYPVVIGSKVAAIIYAGGVITNREESVRRALRCETHLLPLLDGCGEASSDELYRIALAVDSCIRFILSKPAPDQASSLRYPVSEIKALVHSEYKKPLSLKELSGLYFINEKYLGRLFLSETGMTFHEYLNKIRVERARSLLETSDLPILDIAFECGFASVSYFNRVFKGCFSMTPTEYRREFGV